MPPPNPWENDPVVSGQQRQPWENDPVVSGYELSRPFGEQARAQQQSPPVGPAPLSHAQWGEQNPWALYSMESRRFAQVPGIEVPQVESVATRRQQYDPEGYQVFEDWRIRGQEGMPNLSVSDALMGPVEMASRFAVDRLTLGLVDELIVSPDARERQRQAVEGFRSLHPEAAGIIGTLGDFLPAGALGWVATLPKSLLGRLATGFTAGGMEGLLVQAGQGDPSLAFGQRMMQAINPLALLSAATGMVVPTSAAGARAVIGVSQPPTRAAIQDAFYDAARGYYRQLEDSNIYLNDVIYDSGMNSVIIDASRTSRNILGPDGNVLPVDRGGFASVNRIASQIDGYRGQSVSMLNLEGIQQDIAEAIRSTTDGVELRALGALRESMDNWVETITEQDLYRSALQTMSPAQAREVVDAARANYRVASVVSLMEEIEQRAANAPGAYDTALASQMRRVINKPERYQRMFTDEQWDLMRRIAGGDTTLKGRLANTLAWMAPRGWAVSIPVTAALTTGNLAPLVPMGIGTIARSYQSRQTQEAFDRLVNMIIASGPELGGSLPMLPARAIEQGAQSATMTLINALNRGPTSAEPEGMRQPFIPFTPTGGQ